MRSDSTQPAIYNTATGSRRSYSTQPASTTRPPVPLRSNSTQPASTTRPPVLLRSFPTLPAAAIRRSNYLALKNNTTGNNNTAYGGAALKAEQRQRQHGHRFFCASETTQPADLSTAYGWRALRSNTTGQNNIALGAAAGQNLTTGSNNIDIVFNAVPEEEETANSVPAAAVSESNTIRIGKGSHERQTDAFIAGISGDTVAGGVGVIIDSSGHLGTVVSSERFKDEIKPMDKASEAISRSNR